MNWIQLSTSIVKNTSYGPEGFFTAPLMASIKYGNHYIITAILEPGCVLALADVESGQRMLHDSDILFQLANPVDSIKHLCQGSFIPPGDFPACAVFAGVPGHLVNGFTLDGITIQERL